VGGTDVHARLATESPEWLSERGRLVMEIGESQGASVEKLLRDGFEQVEVLPDLAGRDRVVRARRRA
jgi:release factor glutamine methyltransferase